MSAAVDRRPLARAFAAFALFAAVASCAPPALIRTADGRAATTDVAAARREANIARARLDSALRDGDVPRFLALLDERIVVVLDNGDSIVGRAAVARRLTARYDDVRAAAVQLFPGAAVLCLDGMVETASDITIYVGHAQRADTVSTVVSATWRNAGPGAWRLSRFELGRLNATRAPSRAACPRVDAERFAQSRFRFSATLPYTAQSTPQRTSMENQLRSEGYAIGQGPTRCCPILFTPMGGEGTGGVGPAEGFVSLRARLWGPWWVDVGLGLGTANLTTYGYNVVSGSRIRMDASVAQTWSALVQYARGPWRAGAGVAAAQVWCGGLEDRADFIVGGGVPIVAGSATNSVVGGVGEFAYTVPIGSGALVEARLRQRFGMRTPYPAFGSLLGGGGVSLNAATFTVGVGLAY